MTKEFVAVARVYRTKGGEFVHTYTQDRDTNINVGILEINAIHDAVRLGKITRDEAKTAHVDIEPY